jgi:glutathione S-transferase
MALVLYYHPLASFCHKVLVALYENATPFEGRNVDLADAQSSAEMLGFWPVGKISARFLR